MERWGDGGRRVACKSKRRPRFLYGDVVVRCELSRGTTLSFSAIESRDFLYAVEVAAVTVIGGGAGGSGDLRLQIG